MNGLLGCWGYESSLKGGLMLFMNGLLGCYWFIEVLKLLVPPPKAWKLEFY